MHRTQLTRKGALHCALLVLLLWPTASFADATGLTLAEALRLASERNPEILVRRASAEAQTARTSEARRARWPRLSLSSGWSRTDTPALVFAQKLNAGDFTQADFAIDRLNSPDALSHLTTTLAAELPLDVFGKAGRRADAESSRELAAQASVDEAVQDVRLRVVEAYWRTALARRVVEVTQRALESARARERDVEARVGEGAALQADLLRSRARRRQREAEHAERRADAQIAAARLARALGAEAGVTYEPSEKPPSPQPLEGDSATWAARATEASPSLRAARERTHAGAWAARAEERSKWPDLAAWGQVQDDRSSGSGGAQSGGFGVMFRWNVFDPARGKRVAAAAAEARAAELEVRAATDEVGLEVETAFQRAQAARERYLAASGGAEDGREALRVVQERRKQGMATLTDELETESASLAAELEELRAASEAAIADATLRRAAGGL